MTKPTKSKKPEAAAADDAAAKAAADAKATDEADRAAKLAAQQNAGKSAHTVADIPGLQAGLDAKANTGPVVKSPVRYRKRTWEIGERLPGDVPPEILIRLEELGNI